MLANSISHSDSNTIAIVLILLLVGLLMMGSGLIASRAIKESERKQDVPMRDSAAAQSVPQSQANTPTSKRIDAENTVQW